MKDIDMAIELLEKENLALVVVKNGQVIFKSHDKGIKPMYCVATEFLNLAESSAVADKVVGKGAALLCKLLKIKEVYTPLISDTAIEVLEEANIDFSYDKSCKHILNRNKTDLCPVEKMAIESENEIDFLKKLKSFLK